MTWLQLQITTTADIAEDLSDLLTTAGAVSVTFQDGADQPIFEPDIGTTPLWNQTRVIGLFEPPLNIQELLPFLQQQLNLAGPLTYQLDTLAEQDWERSWMENFKPMRFGRKLWICPSWHQPPEHDAINILLDPGLAFGTGTHETTALCLQWLDANPPENKQVLDYGCGSGILGIAAIKLGASKVWAVDIDPQALEATRNNAIKNHISEAELITAFPEKLGEFTVDTLLANILAQPLIALESQFAKKIKPGGQIILSGILESQIKLIVDAYAGDFGLFPALLLDGWACIAGIKK